MSCTMLLTRVSLYQERSWLAYGQPIDIVKASSDERASSSDEALTIKG